MHDSFGRSCHRRRMRLKGGGERQQLGPCCLNSSPPSSSSSSTTSSQVLLLFNAQFSPRRHNRGSVQAPSECLKSQTFGTGEATEPSCHPTPPPHAMTRPLQILARASALLRLCSCAQGCPRFLLLLRTRLQGANLSHCLSFCHPPLPQHHVVLKRRSAFLDVRVGRQQSVCKRGRLDSTGKLTCRAKPGEPSLIELSTQLWHKQRFHLAV